LATPGTALIFRHTALSYDPQIMGGPWEQAFLHLYNLYYIVSFNVFISERAWELNSFFFGEFSSRE
jgi:hypothetical protein